MTLRIVAGALKGRPLVSPSGASIRPTSERHRGALFDILVHGMGVRFEGARVLDLFAGTGALGIEAISRGGRFAVFVEESAEGRGLIRANCEALGLNGCTKILRRDATRLGAAGTIEAFDLVLLDPPYGRRLGEGALAALVSGGWLGPEAVLVLEEGLDAPFTPVEGLKLLDERAMGETCLRFLAPA
ncbi:16S rRNA (guanine(966)-N(2))-methyltransferase RsmD [Aureimonas sp. AU4]|uniref:16S rRNA (guanine(966)-N(2))-methyltransferase RsmD n=1 Tax=Aureimonas sp. AU4 TaxID=1638163 RepID=UPI0007858F30|nr:16S rRNA (guanine(966)-N(2))-methyltransferase RsmD [Aureimonas sp. AU4]